MKKQQVNSFYDELRESFRRIGAIPIPLIALTLWFVAFYKPENKFEIDIKYILPTFVVLFIIILALSNLTRRLYARVMYKLPRVLRYYQPQGSYPVGTIGLILEASDLYAFHTSVAIYYKEEVYEPLIGVGHVENVSDKGLIQVVGWPTEIAYKEVWERVCQNDTLYLKNISVKPSVPKEFLRGVTHESYNK